LELVDCAAEDAVAVAVDRSVQQILDACERLRDRLLIALMFETGCRIGQALGLRHEDSDTDRSTITLRPREDNVNRAHGKSRDPKEIPVRRTLLDLYAACSAKTATVLI
jgi:integrase